jgi:hypothetical protein
LLLLLLRFPTVPNRNNPRLLQFCKTVPQRLLLLLM